jgi:DNA-binding SARP family transcriptional activator
LDCLVRLAELHHGNDVARAISTVERAVALDPYAEELYRRLITLHLEANRPDTARRCYRQLRDRLDDLGAEPDPSTQILIRDPAKQPPLGPAQRAPAV